MSTRETTRPSAGFQFKIQTLLIATFAFALGMVAKNIISGLHPFAAQVFIPSSTTKLKAGDWIAIECDKLPELTQRVRVLSDMTVTLKGIGEVHVGGQNIVEAESNIKFHYEQRFSGDSRWKSIEVFRGDSFHGGQ